MIDREWTPLDAAGRPLRIEDIYRQLEQLVGERSTTDDPIILGDEADIERRLGIGSDGQPDPLREPAISFAPNDWYGHRHILNRFVGLTDTRVRLHGRLQHGWQTCCGFEGEQGRKPEVLALRCPAYVWAAHNLQNAAEEGMAWAQAVGAPFLYLDWPSDPATFATLGAGLLVFPYHSAPSDAYTVDGWAEWARKLRTFATGLGFDSARAPVTVCFHPYDWHQRRCLSGLDIRAVSIGSVHCEDYLTRCAALIGQHAMVLSDRVCTAGFYAMHLGREWMVGGPKLHSVPKAPNEDVYADRGWIKRHFPGLLRGAAHREMAADQLGLDRKKTRQELRETLYAWLPDEAFAS